MAYALFSIDNIYDQPDHNLVAYWNEKPSLERLCEGLGWKPFHELPDKSILYVVNLWNGADEQEKTYNTCYRLREIKEGRVDPR